jgi:hypothetical protein
MRKAAARTITEAQAAALASLRLYTVAEASFLRGAVAGLRKFRPDRSRDRHHCNGGDRETTRRMRLRIVLPSCLVPVPASPRSRGPIETRLGRRDGRV